MIDKYFLNTGEIPTVMPVEIKVRVFPGLFEAQFFDKGGQPVYILEKREPQHWIVDTYEAFTDGLYMELLGIDNMTHAEKFLNKHQNFCISFCDDFGRENKASLISRRDYLRLMLKNIKEFKSVSAIYKGSDIIMDDPDIKSLAHSFLLSSDNPLRLNKDQKIHFEKLLDSYDPTSFEGNYLLGKLASLIEQRTKNIKLVSPIFKPNVEFCCPSLLSAMYQKMLISAYNHEEYRQCANKHCTNYFKVGNRATQKYCEKHLEARRRKQKNYLEKQKQLQL